MSASGSLAPRSRGRCDPRPADRTTLRVDGHAHFHPRFAASRFLDAAVRNLRPGRPDAGGGADRPERTPGACLLLADPDGRDSLDALCEGVETSGRWALRSTGEEESRLATSSDGDLVLLVSGYQIVTDVGLEVLALATDASVPRGRSLRETVEGCLAAGAVTVLPWGFGKWWFRRGRLARHLVETVTHPLFFVGDNGGRPRIGPRPPLFRTALRLGTAVLAGSDPLPLDGEEERVGSYGSVLPGLPPSDRPAAALREHLAGLDASPPVFGRRAELGTFLGHQFRMQIRRRGFG